MSISLGDQKKRRIGAIATVLGLHTNECLCLQRALIDGHITPSEALERLDARLGRSVIALLACTDKEGPP